MVLACSPPTALIRTAEDVAVRQGLKLLSGEARYIVMDSYGTYQSYRDIQAAARPEKAMSHIWREVLAFPTRPEPVLIKSHLARPPSEGLALAWWGNKEVDRRVRSLTAGCALKNGRGVYWVPVPYCSPACCVEWPACWRTEDGRLK